MFLCPFQQIFLPVLEHLNIKDLAKYFYHQKSTNLYNSSYQNFKKVSWSGPRTNINSPQRFNTSKTLLQSKHATKTTQQSKFLLHVIFYWKPNAIVLAETDENFIQMEGLSSTMHWFIPRSVFLFHFGTSQTNQIVDTGPSDTSRANKQQRRARPDAVRSPPSSTQFASRFANAVRPRIKLTKFAGTRFCTRRTGSGLSPSTRFAMLRWSGSGYVRANVLIVGRQTSGISRRGVCKTGLKDEHPFLLCFYANLTGFFSDLVLVAKRSSELLT